MSNIKIKRVIAVMMVSIVMASFCVSQVFGSEHTSVELANPAQEETAKSSEATSSSTSKNETNTDNTSQNTSKEDINSSSETLLNNVSRRDKRIAELSDKYNDKFYGQVAYYLEMARKYSLPICFIGITIGAFNFLIVGNKKLDKKEQGFGWIVGFTIGLVVFNVIPLIFALFVAVR